MCFFFNDTAPTEIYTSCHTLSLHCALPSSGMLDMLPRYVGFGAVRRDPHRFDAERGRSCKVVDGADAGQQERGQLAQIGRSEEHTSELQSLMRISYAVFCLKKKTQRPTPTIEIRTIIENITHT